MSTHTRTSPEMSPTARMRLVGWNARSNARFLSAMGWYSIASSPYSLQPIERCCCAPTTMKPEVFQGCTQSSTNTYTCRVTRVFVHNDARVSPRVVLSTRPLQLSLQNVLCVSEEWQDQAKLQLKHSSNTCTATQNRTEQNRTEQSRVEQNITEEIRSNNVDIRTGASSFDQ